MEPQTLCGYTKVDRSEMCINICNLFVNVLLNLNQILVPLDTLDFCLPIECFGVAFLKFIGGDICIWELK